MVVPQGMVRFYPVPVDYQAKAKPREENYWMPLTAPALPTGEPNWWVKSSIDDDKDRKLNGWRISGGLNHWL